MQSEGCLKEKRLVKKLFKVYKLSKDYAEEEDSALRKEMDADLAKRKKKINIQIKDGVAEYLSE